MATIAIYITCKDRKEAKHIVTALLQSKLIACANMFPIQSMYRWKGKIIAHREELLIGKTQTRLYKKIVALVTKLHSYDVPCIGKFSISYNTPYAKWLVGQTRS